MNPRRSPRGTSDGQTQIEGSTLTKNDAVGLATHYRLTGDDGLQLTIVDVTWSTGERDIRTINRHTSEQRFDRIVHGLRLGVHPAPRSRLRVDLRQAQMTTSTWAQVRQASIEELHRGAGFDLVKLLNQHGAKTGRRSELIADTSTHRNTLCALFPTTATLVPLVAYIATRIIPIQNRHTNAA